MDSRQLRSMRESFMKVAIELDPGVAGSIGSRLSDRQRKILQARLPRIQERAQGMAPLTPGVELSPRMQRHQGALAQSTFDSMSQRSPFPSASSQGLESFGSAGANDATAVRTPRGAPAQSGVRTRPSAVSPTDATALAPRPELGTTGTQMMQRPPPGAIAAPSRPVDPTVMMSRPPAPGMTAGVSETPGLRGMTRPAPPPPRAPLRPLPVPGQPAQRAALAPPTAVARPLPSFADDAVSAATKAPGKAPMLGRALKGLGRPGALLGAAGLGLGALGGAALASRGSRGPSPQAYYGY